MFIYLVDAGIGRTQFDHLRANLRDKTAIARAAAGGKLSLHARDFGNGLARSIHQGTRLGQEWQTAQRPVQVVIQPVALQHGFNRSQ